MKISSISLSQNFNYDDPQKRVAVVEFSTGGNSMLSDAFGVGGNAKHSFRISDDYIVTRSNEDGVKVCDKTATLEKWANEFRKQWEEDTDGIRTKCGVYNFAVSELFPNWVSFTPKSDNVKRISRTVVSWGTREDAKAYAARQLKQNFDKKLIVVEKRKEEEEAE